MKELIATIVMLLFMLLTVNTNENYYIYKITIVLDYFLMAITFASLTAVIYGFLYNKNIFKKNTLLYDAYLGAALLPGVTLAFIYENISFSSFLNNPFLYALLIVSFIVSRIGFIIILCFIILSDNIYHSTNNIDSYIGLLTFITISIVYLHKLHYKRLYNNVLICFINIIPITILMYYKDLTIIDILIFNMAYTLYCYICLSIISFYEVKYHIDRSLYDKQIKLNLFIETMGDATWERDPNTGSFIASERYASMLGYDSPDDIGSYENWRDNLIHPDDKERVITIFEQAIDYRLTSNFDYRIKCKNGSYLWINNKSGCKDLGNGKFLLVGTHTNIHKRKIDEALLELKSKLAYCALNSTLGELLITVLDEAEKITGSTIGFFHFVDGDVIQLQEWSTRTSKEYCNVIAKGQHYPISQAGVWADAIREKKITIHNDYASLPNKKGLPEGHAEVLRELVVPIIVNDKVVSIFGIGNKPIPYDNFDIEIMEKFALIAWESVLGKLADNILKESELKFSSFMEHLPVLAYIKDNDRKIILVNNLFEKVFNISKEWLGKTNDEIWPGEFTEKIKQDDLQVFETGNTCITEETLNEHIYRTIKFLIPRHTSLPWLGGISIDITKDKENEQNLLVFNRLTEQAPLSIFLCNLKGIIIYVNQWACTLTGYTKEEIVGQSPRMFKSDYSTNEDFNEIFQQVSSGKNWNGSLVSKKKDGSLFVEEVSITSIVDGVNKPICFLEIKKDITTEHKLKEKLTYQSTHDYLTELFNRREFEARLTEAIVNPHENILAYIDLDQFKIINDTLGHNAGDDLLKQIVTLIKTNIRPRDILARLGGDEFGVIFNNTSIEESIIVCERIRTAISFWKFIWNNKVYRITASIGIAEIHKENSITTVLANADKACYIAKDNGKNRIEVYNDSPKTKEISYQMKWPSILKLAMDDKRLILFVQPICYTKNIDKISHYEILIRLLDTDKNIVIAPSEFLPAAERYNLIEEIDRYIIINAIDQIKHIEDTSTVFTINVSGPSLSNPAFSKFVLDTIKKSAIATNRLGFEVTETIAVTNYTAAIKFLTSVKEIGCIVLLDDFGSGMSSFSYLKYLPIDIIKIDGMFVKEVCNDPFSEEIINSVTKIAKLLNVKTLAEFVASKDILEKLKILSIDFAQGYYISKPFPLYCLTCNYFNKECSNKTEIEYVQCKKLVDNNKISSILSKS